MISTRFALVALLSSLSVSALACSSSSTEPGGPAGEPTTEPTPSPSEPAPPTGGTPPPSVGGIEAKPGVWTWVPVAGATCANGTPTGIGVNIGTSKRLVVYLQGGGACWDALTCYSLKTAANIASGYGAAEFKTEFDKPLDGSLFDRKSATNPFKDDSMVYIPYCTGDIHAGDREQTYGGKLTKHVGRKNVEADLKQIVAAFGNVDRVVLSGASAGGFGAAVNYWRVKEAFGQKRVDLVDDSGPPFPSAKAPFFSDWNESWDLVGALPPKCAGCAADVSAALPYYAKTYPEARFALLSYDQDDTIRNFYQMSQEQFKTEINLLATNSVEPSPNARYFFVAGSQHTMLGKLGTSSGSANLATFLTDMVNDSASWKSKRAE